MPDIRVLDNQIINKIAAGEVVERPSSVVKELAENAIDAGAKAITVEIKDGGTTLVRVTDNGCGIKKEDVRQAFLRHATSKIEDIDDLLTLITLGFRGEALSSIASVSQVEMVTKTAGDVTGTRIEIHGGEILSEQEIGCADGTSFMMRNLFFNTHARKKFLKKTAAESAYVSDIINKLALGHPEIAFKYINNDSPLIKTDGNGDLKTAILNIYGKDAAKNLIPVDYDADGYRVTGFIGKPEISRANRSYENFFINGRYIKSALLNAAVEEGFKTRLMTGKFPLFVLNLNLVPAEVDVNVHPTKLEVRFSREDEIYQVVLKAVDRAFQHQVLIPAVQVSEQKTKPTFSGVAETKPYQPETRQPAITVPSFNETRTPYTIVTDDAPAEKSEIPPQPPAAEKQKPEEPAFTPFFRHYKMIGQLFNTYWLIEQETDLYLIDQHAAHEKILFEELVSKLKAETVVSQRLVSPQAIRLDEQACQTIRGNGALLTALGFEIEPFGDYTYALRAVPNIFNKPADTAFFIEIIDRLSAIDGSIDTVYDMKLNAIATISCKAAVKANDRLSYIEAKTLIERILKLENPFHCPHGRPTIVKITKTEIEKMFKRLV
ncbi:MAG: DNA mismatch repair endonuclease MutL [Clostridiales bacterium]|jgi:DNA mismatch repair protein MutL|nr:DNA mismatch repair endonuclease MutL [Clostridiales bacterium]